MIITLLGWTAALVGACFTLPQVARILRSRSIAGVSVVAWQIMLGANVGWSAHGFIHHHPTIWLPNLLLLGCTGLILRALRRHGGLPWHRLVGPGLGLAMIMIGLDLALGPVAFAIAAFLPSAVSQLAQLMVLVQSVNLTGVSLAYLALSVVNQILWLSWSVGVGEVSVTICSTVLGTLMVVNLGWALLRRLRWVRPTLATF